MGPAFWRPLQGGGCRRKGWRVLPEAVRLHPSQSGARGPGPQRLRRKCRNTRQPTTSHSTNSTLLRGAGEAPCPSFSIPAGFYRGREPGGRTKQTTATAARRWPVRTALVCRSGAYRPGSWTTAEPGRLCHLQRGSGVSPLIQQDQSRDGSATFSQRRELGMAHPLFGAELKGIPEEINPGLAA